jgi:hypothetical protein
MLLAFCKIVVQSCIQLHRWKDYALSGVGFLLFAGAILVCVYATLLDLFAYSHGMADQILTVVCVLFMGWVGLCLFIKALKEWKILPAWFPPCSAEEKKAKEFLNGKKKQKQIDTLFASKDVTIAELKKALEDPPRHMETQLCPAHIWCTLPSRTVLEPCVICPSLAVRGGSPPVDTQSISIRQPLNLYRDVENTTEEAGERQEENIRQQQF